jgi:sigma-B regulation protein RsbU (phosphoserine phosphatase)
MIAVEASRWQGPARALSQMNDALLRRRIEPKFVTLSCATVSEDGLLTYSNAGHNPPLLVTGGTIRRLHAGGPMLGVFAGATFQEETVQLRPGDHIIMFSDGVTDALNSAAEEFGDQRLLACVGANCDRPPSDLVASALEAVRQFGGGTVHSDDATILVLRYLSRSNTG